jgi:hypothetical protein
MIKAKNVERSLHSWPDWLKAVDEARQKQLALHTDSRGMWSYAGKAVKDLRLPPIPLLRTYFLACVFSEYEYGGTYVFGKVALPPFLQHGFSKMKGFPNYLGYLLADPLRVRPSPPSVWSRQDREFFRDSIKNEPFFESFNIVLSKRHALRQIGSRAKRSISLDTAIACARMRDRRVPYKEISARFGWKPQKDNKGIRRRYATAYRYSALGHQIMRQMNGGQ